MYTGTRRCHSCGKSMSTADDPREADLTTLGFRIGTLSYQCESCGRKAQVTSYPLLAITGFISASFFIMMLPLLFRIYPDFWQALLFAAVILLNGKLLLVFLKLFYENIAYRGIEPWSKVLMFGTIALFVAVPSAFFIARSYEKRLLAFTAFVLFFGWIALLFIRGVVTLVRCPAQHGWSFQLGDFVRILIIAAIFGAAISMGDSSLVSTLIQ